MTVFDERALRQLIAEELRRVLREEGLVRPPASDYVPIAEAAEVVAVTPQTIRAWIDRGRLRRYRAGRELRVRLSELHALLEASASRNDAAELSPEELARLDFGG